MKTANQNSTAQQEQNTAIQSVDTKHSGKRTRRVKIPDDMRVGAIHQTNNYGELEIVEYCDAKNVLVMFLTTGFKVITESGHIRCGRVKDLHHPSVYGVGYVGSGHYKAKVNGVRSKFYETWQGMLQRCYDKKLHNKRPTYIGCTVCEEWHNFQNFAEWMSDQDYKDKHLDKDIKIDGNKIYSPDTCLFVTHNENTVKARAKHYIFTSPDGDNIEVYNLREFCRVNNLHQGDMVRVSKSKLNHHKGWTKYKE